LCFLYKLFFFFHRVWLHNRHRVLTSHRPRHRLVPEIYDWERIYKIEFDTRGMEARRRFFELDQDPLNERRLDDHYGPYIPRKYRDFGRRIRSKRFEDMYYPNV
jgi:small subunit ribosomal protein S30